MTHWLARKEELIKGIKICAKFFLEFIPAAYFVQSLSTSWTHASADPEIKEYIAR